MVDSIRVTTSDNQQIIIGDGISDTDDLKKIKNAVKNKVITSIEYCCETFTNTDNDWTETLTAFNNILVAIDANNLDDATIGNVVDKLKATMDSIRTLSTAVGNANIIEDDTNIISTTYNHSSITDYDIRELMKLLIKAFSELINAQRAISLSTINGIILALDEKISAMEKTRDENYKAAVISAAGQMAAGVLQAVGGIFSGISSGKALKKAKFHTKIDSLTNNNNNNNLKLTVKKDKAIAKQQSQTTNTPPAGTADDTGFDDSLPGDVLLEKQAEYQKYNNLGQVARDIAGSSGNLLNSLASIISAGHTADAKTAEIANTVMEAVLEVFRKMSDEVANQLKTFIEAITSLLSTLSNLVSSANSAELSVTRAV